MDKTGRLRVLHIEDDPAHAELIRRAIERAGIPCDILLAMSRRDFVKALDKCAPDLILSDNRGIDFDGIEALGFARRRYPSVPFLFVSSSLDGKDAEALHKAGATGCLLKSDLAELTRVVRGVLSGRHGEKAGGPLDFKRLFEESPDILLVLLPDSPRYTIVGATRARLEVTQTDRDQIGRGLFEVFPDNPDDPEATGTSNLRASLERVIATRSPDTMAVQKYDIRDPDGKFLSKYWSPKNIPVLGDNGEILYILHRVEEVTELVRATAAGEELRGRTRQMENEVVKRSQELAMANAELRDANARLGELAHTRRQWAQELELMNRELETFSSSVSHDLRGPLRSISGFAQLLKEEHGAKLDDTGRAYLEYVTSSTQRMAELIEDLLKLARVSRTPVKREAVDLSDLAGEVVAALRRHEPGRECEVEIEPGLKASGDKRLVTIVLENLLGNAWKFTSKRPRARIAVGHEVHEGETAFYVRDNGAGFSMDQSSRLFAPFQRLHGEKEFEGTGIGLATVKRIIARHGGRIWVEAEEGKGAEFFFTLSDSR